LSSRSGLAKATLLAKTALVPN